MTAIALVDQSTVAKINMTTLASALAHQLNYHVAPAYGIRAPAVHVAPAPIAGAWNIVSFDDPDQAGALGYHDTDPNGVPFGRIFVRPTIQDGVALSTVWSHEVIEAAVDPWCNLWASVGNGWSSAYEACDPVEGDSYGINGVAVSNFVTAQWFDPNPVQGAKYDYLGKLKAPGTMDAGGYLIRMVDGKVSQVFASAEPTRPGRVAGAPQPSRSEWRIIRELAR